MGIFSRKQPAEEGLVATCSKNLESVSKTCESLSDICTKAEERHAAAVALHAAASSRFQDEPTDAHGEAVLKARDAAHLEELKAAKARAKKQEADDAVAAAQRALDAANAELEAKAHAERIEALKAKASRVHFDETTKALYAEMVAAYDALRAKARAIDEAFASANAVAQELRDLGEPVADLDALVLGAPLFHIAMARNPGGAACSLYTGISTHAIFSRIAGNAETGRKDSIERPVSSEFLGIFLEPERESPSSEADAEEEVRAFIGASNRLDGQAAMRRVVDERHQRFVLANLAPVEAPNVGSGTPSALERKIGIEAARVRRKEAEKPAELVDSNDEIPARYRGT